MRICHPLDVEDLLQAPCPVCGSAAGTTVSPVLWPELTDAWELTPEQVAVLDLRDSLRCSSCGAQLRTMNLARAVLRAVGLAEPFSRLRSRRPWLRVLELNDCGALRTLMYRRRMPRKVNGDFPAVDMQALPYRTGRFDLVLHGDTLEHVPDPVLGLRECRRVLRPGGVLCYTVPVVVGRPSRTRDGLPASYHGTAADPAYLVHTEYGDDVWQQPLAAGFRSVEVLPMLWPSSTALICRT